MGEFDPAGFSSGKAKLDVYQLREAELTHGRVGMLAAAGFLTQEKFHPLFTADGGPAIKQIPALPPALWFLMTLGIGIAESLRIQRGWANPLENSENIRKLKEGYYPGDLGWDPLGLKPEDPEEFRAMQCKELNNGRLGMIAAAGFMAQEAVSGTTWGDYWQPAVMAISSKDGDDEFCYGLPGAMAPMGNFDPAGFSSGKSKLDVYQFREAELTHGRVGMLAAAGFLVQEKFHPLFSADGGPAIKQIPALPPALWFLMTLGIGIAEAVRIQRGWADPSEDRSSIRKLKEGYYPGDLGWDPLGLKPEDPEEFRAMQEKELNNGRLGMIAAAGFMAQEAVSGTTWGDYWQY